VDNVLPDLPESMQSRCDYTLERIEALIKKISQDEVEDIYLGLVEKTGSKLHHQLNERLNVTVLGKHQLLKSDRQNPEPTLWEKFESKYCLLENINTYQLKSKSEDNLIFLQELARYLNGTIIPKADRLNTEKRLLQISDKKSQETS
jgi:hypothetical protein